MKHITFEWSHELLPGACLCKVFGKTLRYVILPPGHQSDLGHYECRGADIEFDTPRGAVTVELDVAKQFFPLSRELLEAAHDIIDGDIAKSYAKLN